MQRLRLINTAIVSLTCWGILVPPAVVQAGTPTAASQSPKLIDVALADGGTLSGQVLDGEGFAIEGAQVTIAQGKEEVSATTSGENGSFTLNNLRGGVYHVTAGEGHAMYRLWAHRTAPPSAKSNVRIVSKQQVVRGQFGCLDPISLIVLTTATATTAISAVSISKANDLEDDIDKFLASP